MNGSSSPSFSQPNFQFVARQSAPEIISLASPLMGSIVTTRTGSPADGRRPTASMTTPILASNGSYTSSLMDHHYHMRSASNSSGIVGLNNPHLSQNGSSLLVAGGGGNGSGGSSSQAFLRRSLDGPRPNSSLGNYGVCSSSLSSSVSTLSSLDHQHPLYQYHPAGASAQSNNSNKPGSGSGSVPRQPQLHHSLSSLPGHGQQQAHHYPNQHQRQHSTSSYLISSSASNGSPGWMNSSSKGGLGIRTASEKPLTTDVSNNLSVASMETVVVVGSAEEGVSDEEVEKEEGLDDEETCHQKPRDMTSASLAAFHIKMDSGKFVGQQPQQQPMQSAPVVVVAPGVVGNE